MRRPAARHAPARNRFGPCSYCGFAIPRSQRRKCPCCVVYYCDELCQERDWALHRNACPYDGWKSAARRALKPLPRNVEANISDFLCMGREMKGPLATKFRDSASSSAGKPVPPDSVSCSAAKPVAEAFTPETQSAEEPLAAPKPLRDVDANPLHVRAGITL